MDVTIAVTHITSIRAVLIHGNRYHIE